MLCCRVLAFCVASLIRSVVAICYMVFLCVRVTKYVVLFSYVVCSPVAICSVMFYICAKVTEFALCCYDVFRVIFPCVLVLCHAALRSFMCS